MTLTTLYTTLAIHETSALVLHCIPLLHNAFSLLSKHGRPAKRTLVRSFADMAGFMSAIPVPGAATEGQTVRPGISLTRYCTARNCRNAIPANAEHTLCGKCLGAEGPDAGSLAAKAITDADTSLLQPTQAGFGAPQVPAMRMAGADRVEQPIRHSISPTPMEIETVPYAANSAMEDERQQNRARKLELEREAEESEGRWRTRQATSVYLDSSPPRLSRSRRTEPDRGVVIMDAYRPNGRYRPHEIDAYRPGRSSPAVDPRRLHAATPQQSSEPDAKPATITAPQADNKRKWDEDSAQETSNKSVTNPGQSNRCGKRQCNRVAMVGKDRCKPCYRAEGRHSGVCNVR